MKKQWFVVLIGILLVPFVSDSVAHHHDLIYVDCSNIEGPWDGSLEHPFRFISDGLNVSENGDTIFVFDGRYPEVLTITTSILLLGESAPVLDGLSHEVILTIQASDVTIQNFIIQNSSGYQRSAGIQSCFDTTMIKNCTIYRTRTAISLHHTSGTMIDNCTLHNNGIGIALLDSDNTLIEGCTIAHNSIGIACENSSAILMRFSYLHTNGRAGLFTSSANITLLHCNISDNSVNHGGVFINDCENITISNCMFRHNGIGINSRGSHDFRVQHSTFQWNTHYAMYLDQQSSDVTISQCLITNNLRGGVSIVDKSSCIFTQNIFEDNLLYGLYSKQSHSTARYNFWGSFLGPSHTAFGKGDQICHVFGQLTCFPWLFTPAADVGASWNHHDPYLDRNVDDQTHTTIPLPGNDTDGDRAPDWWEIQWGYNPLIRENHSLLDPDDDGLNNIEECYTDPWGSNPFHKDIFLEIDWMISEDGSQRNKPNASLLQEAVRLFKDHNITLHINVGSLGGGETIPYETNISFVDVTNFYWHYFLHENLTNPRKGIFHYGIICDDGPDANFPFIGWNYLDSFYVSAQTLQNLLPAQRRDHIIVAAAIHHLGHTLGLIADTYQGIDNVGTLTPLSVPWFTYKNYISTMNYFFKFKTYSYSDGTHGQSDFDDWSHLDFSFFKASFF